MDYSKLSDAEIGQKVGELISFDKLSIISSDGRALIHEHKDIGNYEKVCLGWKVLDPCNNAADAWQIIESNRISLLNTENEWIAASRNVGAEGYMGEVDICLYGSGSFFYDKNPLRAAMIVFLMMQESE